MFGNIENNQNQHTHSDHLERPLPGRTSYDLSFIDYENEWETIAESSNEVYEVLYFYYLKSGLSEEERKFLIKIPYNLVKHIVWI